MCFVCWDEYTCFGYWNKKKKKLWLADFKLNAIIFCILVHISQSVLMSYSFLCWIKPTFLWFDLSLQESSLVFLGFFCVVVFGDGVIWQPGKTQSHGGDCGAKWCSCCWRRHQTERHVTCRHAEVCISHPSIGVEGQFLIQLCRTCHLWSLLSLQNKATDVQPVLWDGSTAQRRYKTILLIKLVFIFKSKNGN